MKLNRLLLGIALTAVVAAGQQPPSISDKTKLAIRDEQLAQAKIAVEFAAIQKQIDDSPLGKRIRELQSQFADSAKRMTEAGKAACGEKFVLDYDRLVCVPQPSPSPK